ncbi:hypothetical protein [Candidatus Albibeggiatoa sp. nov. BB20]|uniref:RCC1 domain-containing protein n=1 Tax=Candidatus Albibeggiatoa sp. nov. BB20 TaxID=3162723 RepID=UPI0033654C0C
MQINLYIKQYLSRLIFLSLLLIFSSTAQALVELTEMSDISGGTTHTCAITNEGGIKCWGRSLYGELGDGTRTDSYTPVNVSGLSSGVSAIDLGNYISCALLTNGGVKCWGQNQNGQIGDAKVVSRVPADVNGLSSGVSSIDLGDAHSCALLTNSSVKCWGLNDNGQLGDGTLTDSSTPVDVNGLGSGVSAIASGNFHNCVLLSSGGVKCWGLNDNGQLGDGTTTQSSTPINVNGLSSGVSAIALGSFHSCALLNSGNVKCWGLNDNGQLGDGTLTDSSTPVDVSGLSGVSTIALSGYHSCALLANSSLKCWGRNDNGELGNGTVTDSLTPIDVSGLSNNVSAIALGIRHSCALLTDDSIRCWGQNLYGQLGDGTTTGRYTPTSVLTRIDQTITGFSPPSAGIYGENANLSATGGASGNTVLFASTTTSVCTVSGSTVNYVGVGTCTVTADQASSTEYNAAPQVSSNITITSNVQNLIATTVTFRQISPSPSTVGQEIYIPFTVTSEASSTVIGLVTISNADSSYSCKKTLTSSHNGQSGCYIRFTEAGQYEFNIRYEGDLNHYLSTGNQTASHQVNAANIIYTAKPILLAESGISDSYTIGLSAQPTNTVTITITPNEQLSINEQKAGQAVTIQLTDTTPVEISVIPIDDTILEGEHIGLITHISSSSDSNYDAKTTELNFPIADNEAGIIIEQTDAISNVTEGGTSDHYSIVLTTKPSQNVTINFAIDEQISVYPTTVIFNRLNWDDPQKIRISAVNDKAIESDYIAKIIHSITTEDLIYNSENTVFIVDAEITDTVSVNITDNDFITAPTSPSAFTTILNANNQAILNWQDNSLDETQFILLRDDEILIELAENTIVYTDSTLQCNTDYSYQLYAKNEAGESLLSDPVSIEFPCLPLQAPSSLTVTAQSDTQINLTWIDNNTDEIGYQIIRNGQIIDNAAQNSANYIDTNLQCGTEYHYLVSAITSDLTLSTATEIFASTQNCIGEFGLNLNIQGQGAVNDCTNYCRKSYSQNQTVELNITPAINWQFSHWDGDCTNSQILMDTDKVCTAHFIKKNITTSNSTKTVQEPETITKITVQPPIIEQSPIIKMPPALPPVIAIVRSDSTLNQSVNIGGQTIRNIKIQVGISVSNGTLGGEVINDGLISNITIEQGATIHGGSISGRNINDGVIQDATITAYSEVTGGQLVGDITNRGTLIDVQLIKESTITGSKLGGIIQSEGAITDVQIDPYARIIGGQMGGLIQGSKSEPVYLGAVELLDGTKVENARISPTTALSDNIKIGKGVIFPKNYKNLKLEDFGIDATKLESIDIYQFNGIEPAAFALFKPEHIEQLPAEVFTAFEAKDIEYLQPEAIAAIKVEQFKLLPEAAFSGLTADNIDALSEEVLEIITPEKLEAIKPKAVKKSKNPGKVFTRLTKIKSKQARKYLPTGWDINEETGELITPAGTRLTYKTIKPKKTISRRKAYFPDIVDLGSSFSLGGTGGKSALEQLNNGMQQTPNIGSIDLDQFIFTQNDMGILNVIGKGGYEGTTFAFLPKVNNIEQAPLDVPAGLSQDEGDFFIMTTPNHQSFFLTPSTNDPVGLVEVLSGNKDVIDESEEEIKQICDYNNQVVKFNEAGDVLLKLTGDSIRRRTRAFETDIHVVIMFDAFVEPAPDLFCNAITCDWPQMSDDLQKGIHLPNKLRARQQAKVIYPNGTSQIVYPTVLQPNKFINLASKLEGIEKVIYQSDGSFKAIYFGQSISIYPTFDTTLKPLPHTNIEIQPEVTLQDNGQFSYSVQDCSRLVTTSLVIE